MNQDTIFERMMFVNKSSIASLEATEREYEIEVYVEGLDIDAIASVSLSKEDQVQWGTYIPKGPENVSDGRIRSRKTIHYDKKDKWEIGDTVYHMTIKTTDPEGGDIESELSAEETVFKQFSYLADQGMVKTRYNIPFRLDDLDLTAEVDVFSNDDGEYVPWVKIDIEYPDGIDWSTHQLTPESLPEVLRPKSPDKVHVVSPEGPQDAPVRKAVKDIYDRYFLKPNPHL